MTDLTSLIEKLEQAEGPKRELDFWLSVRVFDPSSHTDDELQADIELVGIEGMVIEAPFTSSIDAAVSLAERVLPGCFYLASKGKTRHDEPLYAAQIMFGTDEVMGEAESDASLAVAIVAATLRALQQKGSSNG